MLFLKGEQASASADFRVTLLLLHQPSKPKKLNAVVTLPGTYSTIPLDFLCSKKFYIYIDLQGCGKVLSIGGAEFHNFGRVEFQFFGWAQSQNWAGSSFEILVGLNFRFRRG